MERRSGEEEACYGQHRQVTESGRTEELPLFDSVDEHLVFEILKRITGWKSLCRMRCVCKSWKSFISSPFFMGAHQHLHPNNSHLLLRRVDMFRSRPSSFKADRGSPSYAFYRPDEGIPFDPSAAFHSLPFEPSPFRTREGMPLRLFDATHGVVCLTSESPYPTTAILWNPSINTYIKVPSMPFQFDHVCDHTHYAPSLGFGFSPIKNDFMLMRLWLPLKSQRRRPQPLLHEVFSPRDGVSVKAVAAARISACRVVSKSSLFIKGTIHWIIHTEKSHSPPASPYYRLLMFDCGCNKFTTMKLPKRFDKWRNFPDMAPILLQLQGMLAIKVATSEIEVWVMERYGVVGSWKRTYEKDHPDLFGLVSHESKFLVDAKCPAFSYVKKQGNGNEKPYYKIDGTTCQYILI